MTSRPFRLAAAIALLTLTPTMLSTVEAGQPPEPPVVTATAVPKHVSLFWTAPATESGAPVLAYRVYRGSPTCDAASLLAVRESARTLVDKSVALETTYCYYVTAENRFGESAPSAPVTLTVPPVPDLVVTRLDISPSFYCLSVCEPAVAGSENPLGDRLVEVTVANLGAGATVMKTNLTVWACDGAILETCELVGYRQAGLLAPNATLEYQTTWPAFGRVGRFEFCAKVEYGGLEASGPNKACTHEAVLTEGAGFGVMATGSIACFERDFDDRGGLSSPTRQVQWVGASILYGFLIPSPPWYRLCSSDPSWAWGARWD
ncbi:MAG TPA: fibronectin type III domain-containing protein [Candidatus Thermoplasmatota archaeon]|nr:fibronectin type III domain-containing protein [Candidatus Thermoplasmatota archaeon]